MKVLNFFELIPFLILRFVTFTSHFAYFFLKFVNLHFLIFIPTISSSSFINFKINYVIVRLFHY